MRAYTPLRTLMTNTAVMSVLLVSTQLEATTIGIDLRNDQWTNSGVTQTGWSPGAASGSTYYSGADVTLTMTSTMMNVTAGANNLQLFPNTSNTAGFGFQNAGVSDINTGATLENYQRIDFSFTKSVIMNNFTLEDLDTKNLTGSTGWRDAVAIQTWAGATAPTLASGLGVNAAFTFESTTNLTSESKFGLDVVYASVRGNTVGPVVNGEKTNNPLSSVNFNSSGVAIDGFSIFFFNRSDATLSTGDHGIALRSDGSSFTVIPEPSSLIMLSIGAMSLCCRRSRRL